MRDPLDRDYSPSLYVAAMLDRFGFSRQVKPGISVLEPCAGGGAISKPLLALGYDVETWDLDPEAEAYWHGDSMAEDLKLPNPDYVVTNPPFRSGEYHAKHWVARFKEVAKTSSVFLLPITFLEPTSKRERERRAHLLKPGSGLCRILALPRGKEYSFRGSGADRVACAWMEWRPGYRGPAVYESIAHDELMAYQEAA